jgi:hypothetical protein
MLNDQSTAMRHRYLVWVEETFTTRKIYTYSLIGSDEGRVSDRAEYHEASSVVKVEEAAPVTVRKVINIIKQEI